MRKVLFAGALALAAPLYAPSVAHAGPIRNAVCAFVEKVKETRSERKAHRSSGAGCGKTATKTYPAGSVQVATTPVAPAPCKDCQK